MKTRIRSSANIQVEKMKALPVEKMKALPAFAIFGGARCAEPFPAAHEMGTEIKSGNPSSDPNHARWVQGGEWRPSEEKVKILP